MDCIWNRIPIVENLWKIATIYFQAQSVFRHSKMRENVAETADTNFGAISVDIDYGKMRLFIYFYFFQYSSLSKIFCQISVKNRHAHVQFYLRRVHSFCSVHVRRHGNRKAHYASIKNLILSFFHGRRRFVF